MTCYGLCIDNRHREGLLTEGDTYKLTNEDNFVRIYGAKQFFQKNRFILIQKELINTKLFQLVCNGKVHE